MEMVGKCQEVLRVGQKCLQFQYFKRTFDNTETMKMTIITFYPLTLGESASVFKKALLQSI
uniref:Uncharacterized protein n=1 Tax=Anguilla anguilla TaxID=7936 RepID=A0A0E9XEM3_ANGAN